jgi:hypothetical protein
MGGPSLTQRPATCYKFSLKLEVPETSRLQK